MNKGIILYAGIWDKLTDKEIEGLKKDIDNMKKQGTKSLIAKISLNN